MPDKDKAPATVFRDFRGTRGLIEDADPTPERVAGKREITPGASTGVTTEQAMRSERPPQEGEGTRAFGPPTSTPKPSTRPRPTARPDPLKKKKKKKNGR